MICAVVLAAGESRRMGTQKLLLEYCGRPLITHVVDQLLASKIEGVYVVTGHDHARLTCALAGRDVCFVANPAYTTGMLSSVRCGFGAIPQLCKAVVVTLGDQPAITPNLVNRLVEAHTQTGKGIVVPLYKGRRGHPTLIAASYRGDIMTRYDDVGLRGLLSERASDVFELNVTDVDVTGDMDTPEDYARHIERANRQQPGGD